MTNKYLLLLTGPTAVGKTALSIRLAQFFGTEIISADSRQFYREMEIGTAKPSLLELGLVKHHFINNLSVEQEYTSGIFEKEALAVLEALFKKHSIVILTGGSGLFIKALCEGLDEIPAVDASIRETLNLELKEKGLDFLLEELKEKDIRYYDSVDRSNPVRIIRALEIIRGTGMPFSYFRKSIKKVRPFSVIKIGLNRDREELYNRIDLRMEAMLKNGLLEEVTRLLPFKNLNALQTVGYAEVFSFLNGEIDYLEMERLLKRNSRHYAKRQLTWFAKDKEMIWFHPDQEKEIIERVRGLMLKG